MMNRGGIWNLKDGFVDGFDVVWSGIVERERGGAFSGAIERAGV